MDFDTRYKKLNAAQKQAVDTIDGPVMVVAGPGTGKTELLSMRVASILKRTDTLPSNILCLTFTDSGAAAMRQRLSEIIGTDGYKVAIHTFHSFGTEVINQNAQFFYQGANFRAADDLSSYELIGGIFDELDYQNPLSSKLNGEYTYLADTLSTISELKKSGLTSDELLTVLSVNDVVIEQTEPLLQSAFSGRLTKQTIELLQPVVAATRALMGADITLPAIVPLSEVLADSLESVIQEASGSSSTKPITAWRNAWMKKDDTGNFVLKSRERQAKLRAVSYVYYQYLVRMQEAELFDFDDMILRVVHAMEVFPELRYNLQEKYQYILVDEFQDTNLAQMRILYNLTNSELNEGSSNIMVVGDDDQAIYSFQGADISNILNFEETYPGAAVITLTDNYRSSAPVLEAAREVITQGSERLETIRDDLDKTLTPHRTDETPVALHEAKTLSEEREYIARQIKTQIEQGTPAESIAVLARRHYELVGLLPYLADAHIPVNYERQDNVLDIEPIKLLENVAQLVVDLFEQRHDHVNAQLPEIMAHPAWGFSASQIWKLSLTASQQHKSWMEVMSETPEFMPFHTWLITTAQRVPLEPLEQIIDVLLGKVDLQISDDSQDDSVGADNPVPDAVSDPLAANINRSWLTAAGKAESSPVAGVELLDATTLTPAPARVTRDGAVLISTEGEIGADRVTGSEDSDLRESSQGTFDDGNGDVKGTYVSPLYNYFFPPEKLVEQPDEYLVFLEALRTIRTKLRNYQPNDTPTIRTFLQFIDLHRRLGSTITSIRPHVEEMSGAINLMTAHKSKGLEFDNVYITGAIDTAWGERVRNRSRLIGYPENLPLAPSGDRLDDRLRLFFVAMTRAKKRLNISYSLTSDDGKVTLPASFLTATDLVADIVDIPRTTSELVDSAERRWYEPLISLTHGTMQELLAPTLERYKLSSTHLNNFIDVTIGGPQAFLLSNLLKFPKARSAAASYGIAMHATLQRAHAHLAATSKHRAPEDILHDYEENLRAQHLSEDDFGVYLQKGSDALSVFLEAKYVTFTPSQKVELNFASQHVLLDDARLTGSLDLVDIDPHERTIVITDYKTGRAAGSWQGRADYEKIKLHKYKQQLMFYRLLVEHSRDYANYRTTGSILQFVEPTPRGDIVCLEAEYSEDEYDRFKLLVGKVWQHICTLNLPTVSEYDMSYKGILQFESDIVDGSI